MSLAEVRYLVKEFRPFFYNLFITSLDNSENVLQNMRVDMRIIMSQEAFPGLRNPNFEGVPSDTWTWIGSNGLFSLDQK